MSVFKAQTIDDLPSFPDTSARLALLERSPPGPARPFFEVLTQTPFRVSAIVSRDNARDDIMWALA